MRIVYVVVACIAVGLFGAMALAKLPHALYGKRIAGQVVDAQTGAPIPGAHVAFLWESTIIPHGFTGHNARDICYHAAAAVTDRDGRFDVP
ncbi:MAG: carboxypeptidase-like regulatory domain-containing protein, partial [Rudaea sp.]